MSDTFQTIAQSIYYWVVNTLFGEIPNNTWYTSHLDVLRGAFTVAMCCVVVFFAIWLVVAVARFLGRLLRW